MNYSLVAIQSLQNFIKNLGLSIECGTELLFQNKTIFVESWIWYTLKSKDPKKYFISQIAHELGHFLIAPKSRRYKENYGIPPNVRRDYWDLDEVKAQLVEFHLLQYFHLTNRKYIERFGSDWMHEEAKVWFKEVGKKKIDLILKSGKLD